MKHLTFGPLWIAFVAALSACTKEDEAPRQLVSLTASEYSIAAPDTVLPGWTTFRLANHGTEVHYGRSHIEHGMIRQISVH